MATILDELTLGQLDVDAITATELSGFGMRLDMSDTLAVAVSQSGTTTDTNRTVDLLRSRGAAVIGIVNRRGSDLTDKADGVLYTSDGRDVEMSVASTKAFYAQVAAGTLLSCAIAEAAGLGDPARRSRLLADLRGDARCDARGARPPLDDRRGCPSSRALPPVLGDRRQRPQQGRRRGGPDQAQRALLQVDRLRLHGGQEAHRPVVRALDPGVRGRTVRLERRRRGQGGGDLPRPQGHPDRGGERWRRRASPPTSRSPCRRSMPALGFVLSAMVGHLFGYEAALAIDATARPMREAREAIEHLVGEGLSGDEVRRPVGACIVRTPAERFHDGLRNGLYDGHLEASSATRLSGLLRDMLSRPAGRAVPARHRQGRYAARPDRRSRRRADQGDRGAHAARRHDQAPGQDGHRRHLPQRRGRHRPPARPGRVGGRCRPRRVDLPHDEGARRPRPGRRRGHGLHAVWHRRTIDLDRRSRRHLPRSSEPRRAEHRTASARSTASPPSARCSWPRDATTGAR